MRIWIGVENFAKIESAKVCVDQYTLFVGPNNSGKTFLMQLLQGLSSRIVEFVDEEAMKILLADRIDEYRRYLINGNNLAQFTESINKNINLKKEQVVKEIFGREVPIERLYIDLELEENVSCQIDIFNGDSLRNENVKRSMSREEIKFGLRLGEENENVKMGVLFTINGHEKIMESLMLGLSLASRKIDIFKRVLRTIFVRKSLFLPASRTGLMLLYREFFTNKTDQAISYQVGELDLVKDEEQYGGLTQPMYEFLRFLQTYSEDEEERERYKQELDFFEDKIIEGHVNVSKQGKFSYYAKGDSQLVPMYLASAMVNEVAPLVLALTSERRYEMLIIDEVEASLHPQKQLELVRFLNRINNKGIRLILSTHSDAFVSKLNNLFLLSEQFKNSKDDEIKRRFHIEEEDLTSTDKIFVYEFVFHENGKSIVKEIIPDPKMGYKFDLFTKSAMDLYDEALRLGEMHSND